MTTATRPKLKAVIFDLDGVLCDTSIYHARAWADLVRAQGHEPPADIEERVKGVSRMQSLRIALGENAAEYSEAELAAMAARKNDCYVQAIQGMTGANLFPGVPRLFRALREADIRIVLGSASKNARLVLDRLGITDRFDAIADGHTYSRGKPDPDVFLTAARMVGTEPAECIVIEDAEAGIEAALAGGFTAIGMGNPESLRKAHVLIDSLEALSVERLRSLHARFAAATAAKR